MTPAIKSKLPCNMFPLLSGNGPVNGLYLVRKVSSRFEGIVPCLLVLAEKRLLVRVRFPSTKSHFFNI